METALEIAAAVRRGEVGAVEVTTAALERAARRGPAVGAFVELTPELALAQAREVDAAVARGEGGDGITGLELAGVPIPVKDLNQVAGVPLRAGSRVLAAQPIVPEVDDGTVVRLREAGSTMIGKTATPEFGFPPYTEPRTGPDGSIVAARTPWDLRRGAGGSSGGAAAAVAAGIVPLAHASDGGGSIRIPAASCGIVGFKPSRGLVSTGPWGVDGNGLATQGVVSRTVLDTALALDVLGRGWPGDGPRPGRSGAPRASGGLLAAALDGDDDGAVRGLRVGILTAPVVAGDAVVHPEAVAAAERAVRTLEAGGAVVGTAPVPFTPQEWLAFMPLWSVGALTLPVPDEAEELLEPLTRWLREVGRSVSGADYARAVADAQRVARQVATAWDAFDVVVTPSLAGPPAPVGSIRNDADPARDFEDQKRFTPWTSIANIAGLPSVSLPVHRAVLDDVELPFGAMLTGRLGQDGALLATARHLELADPWPAPPSPTP
ncbi:amidase [Serinibacter arcticus]|uniref:Aspartyl-tRNA(Asn) amidotransferase subunit A n=1 Tax=Serinibacter arcticus TaxID=1655435 RepID=A0A4Z1E0S8_9MICO|nr:amidase [Serinibacter arcticus]TGO05514.1 Aspartyl-tRNA(Asn) amidotransferase subunit A [Serinibacter arcticus]